MTKFDYFPFISPKSQVKKERKKEKKKLALALGLGSDGEASETMGPCCACERVPSHPTLKRKGINKAPSALRGRRRRRRRRHRPQSLIAVARKS